MTKLFIIKFSKNEFHKLEKSKMTFFHFINCLGLSCAPYFLTYKYAGL
jgi:hypothetical protein